MTSITGAINLEEIGKRHLETSKQLFRLVHAGFVSITHSDNMFTVNMAQGGFSNRTLCDAISNAYKCCCIEVDVKVEDNRS